MRAFLQGVLGGVVRGAGLQKYGAYIVFATLYLIAGPVGLPLLLLTNLKLSGKFPPPRTFFYIHDHPSVYRVPSFQCRALDRIPPWVLHGCDDVCNHRFTHQVAEAS